MRRSSIDEPSVADAGGPTRPGDADAAGRLSGKFVAWFSDDTTAAPAQ